MKSRLEGGGGGGDVVIERGSMMGALGSGVGGTYPGFGYPIKTDLGSWAVNAIDQARKMGAVTDPSI